MPLRRHSCNDQNYQSLTVVCNMRAHIYSFGGATLSGSLSSSFSHLNSCLFLKVKCTGSASERLRLKDALYKCTTNNCQIYYNITDTEGFRQPPVSLRSLRFYQVCKIMHEAPPFTEWPPGLKFCLRAWIQHNAYVEILKYRCMWEMGANLGSVYVSVISRLSICFGHFQKPLLNLSQPVL